MAKVVIPPLLRELTGGRSEVTAEGKNVREVIASLDQQFPGLGERLRVGDALARGIAVDVDGQVPGLGLLAPVAPDSEIHFLPAISGG